MSHSTENIYIDNSLKNQVTTPLAPLPEETGWEPSMDEAFFKVDSSTISTLPPENLPSAGSLMQPQEVPLRFVELKKVKLSSREKRRLKRMVAPQDFTFFPSQKIHEAALLGGGMFTEYVRQIVVKSQPYDGLIPPQEYFDYYADFNSGADLTDSRRFSNFGVSYVRSLVVNSFPLVEKETTFDKSAFGFVIRTYAPFWDTSYVTFFAADMRIHFAAKVPEGTDVNPQEIMGAITPFWAMGKRTVEEVFITVVSKIPFKGASWGLALSASFLGLSFGGPMSGYLCEDMCFLPAFLPEKLALCKSISRTLYTVCGTEDEAVYKLYENMFYRQNNGLYTTIVNAAKGVFAFDPVIACSTTNGLYRVHDLPIVGISNPMEVAVGTKVKLDEAGQPVWKNENEREKVEDPSNLIIKGLPKARESGGGTQATYAKGVHYDFKEFMDSNYPELPDYRGIVEFIKENNEQQMPQLIAFAKNVVVFEKGETMDERGIKLEYTTTARDQAGDKAVNLLRGFVANKAKIEKENARIAAFKAKPVSVASTVSKSQKNKARRQAKAAAPARSIPPKVRGLQEEIAKVLSPEKSVPRPAGVPKRNEPTKKARTKPQDEGSDVDVM